MVSIPANFWGLSGFANIQEDYPHAEDDCILLVKYLVNSESLSQKPLTFLPAHFVQKLTKPLACLPRNLLSERARKELLVGNNLLMFLLLLY